MYDDYLKEVLAAYKKKKDEAKLPPNLFLPTPGNLRNECVIVHRERPATSDDEILRLFFIPDKEKGYSKSIENFNAEGFKQLSKILKGKVDNPGVKFIDLLAWLIDFNPRPSTLYYKQNNKIVAASSSSEISSSTKGPENEQASETPPANDDKEKIETGNNSLETSGTDDTGKVKHHPKRENSTNIKLPTSIDIIISIILLIAGIGTFLFWEHFNNTIRMPTPDEKCMYWTGKHYEPNNCNEEVGYMPIVPLNIETLRHLKRISWPDRLTKDALGKVWYSSIGREYEFFTDSGMHPVDTAKRLRPLTPYILANHVSHYRYLLTVVIGIVCVIALFILCVFSLKYLRRAFRK